MLQPKVFLLFFSWALSAVVKGSAASQYADPFSVYFDYLDSNGDEYLTAEELATGAARQLPDYPLSSWSTKMENVKELIEEQLPHDDPLSRGSSLLAQCEAAIAAFPLVASETEAYRSLLRSRRGGDVEVRGGGGGGTRSFKKTVYSPPSRGVRADDLRRAIGLRVAMGSSAPEQVHLSPAADPGALTVMWVTKAPTEAPQVRFRATTANGASGFVNNIEINDKASAPWSTAAATVTTYHVGTIEPWKGWIYRAEMSALPQDTKVEYTVGSEDGGWSPVFKTRAISHDTNPNRAHTFAIYGDMGTAIPLGFLVARDVAGDISRYGFEGVIHIGDLAYAGTGAHAEIEAVWDIFCAQIEQMATRVPYYTTVGNHEKYFNYTSFRTRFSMPPPWGQAVEGDPQMQHRLYFSYDVGPVHFTSMSTEHPYTPGTEQYAWIERDLAAARANTSAATWIVLLGHRPMLCSDVGEWSQHRPGAPLFASLGPLMEKYGVDLYASGHMHIYERIHPTSANGTVVSLPDASGAYVNPRGAVQLVVGTGGVFTDHKWMDPLPAFSAARSEHISYGRLRFANATHLQYEQVQGSGQNANVVDRFSIVKEAARAYES